MIHLALMVLGICLLVLVGAAVLPYAIFILLAGGTLMLGLAAIRGLSGPLGNDLAFGVVVGGVACIVLALDAAQRYQRRRVLRRALR
jgi:hypothetical protein